MTTTISEGATSISPAIVDGYEVARRSGNIVHDILGSTEPAVTLRAAGLRSGTLRMVMGTSETFAKSMETLLSNGKVYTLVDSDRATVQMNFIASGEITRSLDDETREVWIVTCDFVEVAP